MAVHDEWRALNFAMTRRKETITIPFVVTSGSAQSRMKLHTCRGMPEAADGRQLANADVRLFISHKNTVKRNGNTADFTFK